MKIKCPYRGLQPLSKADQPYFAGREKEVRIILSNIYGSPLTVLYGESGVGKTSLIRAGLLPELERDNRAAAILFRDWQSPDFERQLRDQVLQSLVDSINRFRHQTDSAEEPLTIDKLKKAFCVGLELSAPEELYTLPFHRFIQESSAAFYGKVFFIFDQFEEYIYYHPLKTDGDRFDSALASAINDRQISASFLLSLREDGLGKLDRLRGRIPELLGNIFRLEHLDRDGARRAIERPLEVFSYGKSFIVEAAPELKETLLDQVDADRLELDEADEPQVADLRGGDGGIRYKAVALQAVLTQLWEVDVAPLREGKSPAGTIKLKFDTLRKLAANKKEPETEVRFLVRTYFDKKLEKLSQVEKECAAEILRGLVRAGGHKRARTAEKLAKETLLSPQQVKSLLEKLSANPFNILRKLEAAKNTHYELNHDVMAFAIMDWSNRERQTIRERRQLKEFSEREEMRQKVWRRRIVASVGMIAVLLLGLFWSIYERNKAKAAEQTAKEQKQNAQTEKDNAEAAERHALQQSKVARSESLRVRKQNLNDNEIIITLVDKLLESATPEEAAIWHMWKLDALSSLDRIPEAIQEEKAVLEKDPDNFSALFEQAYLYNTQGEPEKALAASDALLKRGYDDWMMYQNRAQTLGLLGRYKEGEEAFRNSNEKFIVRGQESSETHVSPAIQRATRRKILTAPEAAAHAANYYGIANLRAYDGDPTFLQALDEACEQPSQGDAALIALNWAWMHMEKRPQDYGALITQAALWERAQLPALAKNKYVDFEEVHRTKADPRYDRLADWVGKRLQELQAVGEPVDDEPDVEALRLEAKEQIARQEYEVALKCIDDAIPLDPANLSLLLEHAKINSYLKDWDAVNRDAKAILEKAPRTSAAHTWHALAMKNLGEPERAVEEEFGKAIEYDKTDPSSMIEISDLLAERDPDQALGWLEQSRHVCTDRETLADIYQRIALLQLEKKRFPEAAKSIETAIAIKRDELRFYIDRANIERKSGTINERGKTNEAAVVRHLCKGYVQAGDTHSQLAQKPEALSQYWLSIEGLASLRKSEDDRKLIADTVSKISNIIESTASRAKAAEFWKTAIESRRWNEVRKLLDNEEKRLSTSR